MKEDEPDKLMPKPDGFITPEDLFITELDERLELAVLNPDVNIGCPNNKCNTAAHCGC